MGHSPFVVRMRHNLLAKAVSPPGWWAPGRVSLLDAGGRIGEPPDVWIRVATAAGLMLLAAILRFASIGDRSLWLDEAVAAFAANRSLGDVIAFSRGGDPHPPLYYLVLSVWIKMFGTGEAALRSVGVVASTLAVGVTWWLGRRIGGAFVAVVAAFLTAVAPLHVVAAQEARMYPLLGLFMVVSWAALLEAADGRSWAWPVYVVTSVLALYTHYFAVLMLAGQAIFVLAAAPHTRRQWLMSQLLILIVYVPWLPVLIETLFSGRGWPFVRPPIGLHTLLNFLGLVGFGGHILGFDGYFGWDATPVPGGVQIAIVLPFLALALAGALSLRRSPRALWLLACYFLIPLGVALVFSLRYNVFYPRYFSFLVPPFAILMACGIAAGSSRCAPTFRRAVALGLVLAHLGFAAPALDRVYASGDVWNWRAAASLVAVGSTSEDLIMFIPAFGSIPFQYYYKGRQRTEQMTPRELWDVTGGIARPDPAADAVNREAFRGYAARHKIMWIVATRPFPAPAWERLKRLLAGLYDIEGLWQFKGVWVVKAVRYTP